MLLHEMDYLKYVSVRRDYIVLPEGALTNATRLRWWQPFIVSSGLATPSMERAQWAIDNILVGGSDINPSTLLDTFDDGESVNVIKGWKLQCGQLKVVLRRLLLLLCRHQREFLMRRAGRSTPTPCARPASVGTPRSTFTGQTRTKTGRTTSWPLGNS